jgi:hypothetical protein
LFNVTLYSFGKPEKLFKIPSAPYGLLMLKSEEEDDGSTVKLLWNIPDGMTVQGCNIELWEVDDCEKSDVTEVYLPSSDDASNLLRVVRKLKKKTAYNVRIRAIVNSGCWMTPWSESIVVQTPDVVHGCH